MPKLRVFFQCISLSFIVSFIVNSSLLKGSVIMAPKVLLPDAVKQEIQALVSSNCKELVFQGRDAKETVQWDMMRKSYHGTESHTSHLKLFMQGKPPFDCCFNRVELQNNREGNEDRDSFMLELKEILHCTIGKYKVSLSI